MSTAAASITRLRTVLYPNAPWYFLAAIATTWIGFSRYLLHIGHASITQHVHGASAGLWMLLLVLQPILYQRGALALHRRLGCLGVYTLVPLFVLGGALMLRNMIRLEAAASPVPVYTLAWLDLWALVLFPLFVVLAVRYARDTDLHARYMVCTVLELLPPALTRILVFVPWVDTIAKSVDIAYGLMVVILLLLLRDDQRKGRLRAPYLVALALYVPMLLTMNHAAHWPWWQRLADRFAAL